jgi:Uma2 family endonuclease
MNRVAPQERDHGQSELAAMNDETRTVDEPAMSTIVPEPMVPDLGLVPDMEWPPLHRLTVEQFEAMRAAGILDDDDAVELIDGLLVAKMTKKPPHVVACELTFWAIHGILPPGWRPRWESPVRVPRRSEPEPDISVVRGEDPRENKERHPGPNDVALLVEVSESSLGFNRRAKLRIYAAADIPFYWIVNLVDRQLEVYSEPHSGGYRSHQHLGPEEQVVLVIDGREVGRITVSDLLP